MMRYFITGATGFIGGRVAAMLAEEGHDVIALVRNPAHAGALERKGVHVHKGDVADRERMRAGMEGVDGVFHIAGWYKIGVRENQRAYDINVNGTKNVLSLMQELRIPKGVYTSSIVIFSDTGGKAVDETYRFEGEHLSHYNRSKALAHEAARAFMQDGLPLVIVLPGLVYGPGDTSTVRPMLISYLQRRLVAVPNDTAFSWAHVDDVARGHILAMERGRIGEEYIISGEPHTVAEALTIAERFTGIPMPKLRIPRGVLRSLVSIADALEQWVPLPDNFSAEYLRMNGDRTYIGDDTKARRELGFSPRPLSEGLPETLDHEMRLLGMTPPRQTRDQAA